MTHPLAQIVRDAAGLVLIGDSSQGRFPSASYHAYTVAGLPFHCLDLGGLTASRGATKGGVVHPRPEDVPDDHGDLAVLWVKPGRSVEATEIAHQLGCTRIWFSFMTAHVDAVDRARELGMEIVEVGRCPVYWLEDAPMVCRLHTAVVRLSGTLAGPPRTDVDRSARELI